MASDIITSILTGGSNNYATTSEQANGAATDFVSQGVVGAITNTAGVSPATGSFAVNAQGTPAMLVDVSAGVAYISGAPTGQGTQMFRAKMASAYTSYAISSNASGSTKYDWIYLKFDPTNGANPSATGNNVITLTTSRSSSNSTDNGTPPTYGLLLAVITVANGASSITNANIADKRINTSIGAQGGSLIVTQASPGTDAIVQAAGTDANISLSLKTKGTGSLKVPSFTTANMVQSDASGNITASGYYFKRSNNGTIVTETTAMTQHGWGYAQGTGTIFANATVTFPVAFTTAPIIKLTAAGYKDTTPPSSISDSGAWESVTPTFYAPSTTGFSVRMGAGGATIASTRYVLFTWEAQGN